MKRVTGLGGFFFKTPDVKRSREWYAKHLGIPFAEGWDGWAFEWQNAKGEKADPIRDDGEFGKFAWVYDPDGNKVELWEPPAGQRG